MLLYRREFQLFADFFQFYLEDEEAHEDLSGEWNETTVSQLLVVGKRTIGIGTARFGSKVRLGRLCRAYG